MGTSDTEAGQSQHAAAPLALRSNAGLGPLPTSAEDEAVVLARLSKTPAEAYERGYMDGADRERERNSGWFALVMNAAAALEDAAHCLRDPDAKCTAEGAAKHYRAAAKTMLAECVGPNVRGEATTEAGCLARARQHE